METLPALSSLWRRAAIRRGIRLQAHGERSPGGAARRRAARCGRDGRAWRRPRQPLRRDSAHWSRLRPSVLRCAAPVRGTGRDRPAAVFRPASPPPGGPGLRRCRRRVRGGSSFRCGRGWRNPDVAERRSSGPGRGIATRLPAPDPTTRPTCRSRLGPSGSLGRRWSAIATCSALEGGGIRAPRAGRHAGGWLPLHHDFGLIRFIFGPLFDGCGCYLVESSMATLGSWLQTISRTRATITGAPDFAFRVASRLVPAGRVDLRSLRVATSGGEAVRLSSITMFESHFDVPGRVRPGYGLAEATLGVTNLAAGEALRTDASARSSAPPPARRDDPHRRCRGPSGATGARPVLVKGPRCCRIPADPGATGRRFTTAAAHGDVVRSTPTSISSSMGARAP